MEDTELGLYLPHMSENEYEVMLLLWRENRALSSVDIRRLSEGKNSVHYDSVPRILARLLKKGYIEHEGYVKNTKHITETFRAKVSQADFLLRRFEDVHADSQEKSEAAFSVVTAFLARYCNVKQERLGRIRDIVNEKAV